jgi:hypothetical protein
VKKLENKNISENERTLLHKELLHHTENKAKSAEASNKNLEQRLDLTKDKPKESSTNILNEFIETYKEFLSTLSLEQIGAATQYTVHSTQYTVHSTQYTVHSYRLFLLSF